MVSKEREPKLSPAERRRRQEANRRPDKDRTAHEASRGKKMPTLADLSRELPSEHELVEFLDILAQEPSDRTAAIMAASLLEHALYAAVTARMVDPGPTTVNLWFEAPNAPFATFADKIKLGRALGIYGEQWEKALNQIRDIRNVFAHRASPIDFRHPTIIKEVKKIAGQKMIGENPARVRFCAACLKLATKLVDYGFEHGGKDITLAFP